MPRWGVLQRGSGIEEVGDKGSSLAGLALQRLAIEKQLLP